MKSEISDSRFQIQDGSVTQEAEYPVEARGTKVRFLPDPFEIAPVAERTIAPPRHGGSRGFESRPALGEAVITQSAE